MKASQKFTQRDVCTDQIKMTAKKDIDSDLRNSLIDPEHGLLKPGCMPQVQTANAAGSKQLLDAISKAISTQKIVELSNKDKQTSVWFALLANTSRADHASPPNAICAGPSGAKGKSQSGICGEG